MAGGFATSILDSVEVNVAGEKGWKFGVSLDSPLTGPRGVTVMSKFYLIGNNIDTKVFRNYCFNICVISTRT